MKSQYLEVGKIVNTQGIKGELKVLPWANSPEFLLQFHTLYINQIPYQIDSARVQKGNVIVKFHGIDNINDAQRLREKVLYFDRGDVTLPEGKYFLADLIGMKVVSVDDGSELGTLNEVLTLPSGNVYSVSGKASYLIPAVDEFIREIDPEGGVMRVHILEGMEQ